MLLLHIKTWLPLAGKGETAHSAAVCNAVDRIPQI